MRVTFNMMTSSMCDNVSTSSANLLRAQNIASTGKRITKPSDDVTGTGQALRLQSAISDIDQYTSNCTVANDLLSTASSTLTSVVSTLQEVRNLTSQGASATLSDSAKAGIAAQLDELSGTLVQYANTQNSGTYVFSGSAAKTPAMAASTSGTAPYTYQGNSASLSMQIGPGSSVTVNVTADKIFNIGSTSVSGSPDVFSLISKIKQQVTNGDVEGLSASLKDVDADLANVSTLQTQMGARLSRVTTSSNALASTKTAMSDILSKTTDADYTQAIIDLKTQENIYSAATSTASSVLQLSLVNFLK